MKISYLFSCCLAFIFSVSQAFCQSPETKQLIDGAWEKMSSMTRADSLARLAFEIAIDKNEYWGQYQALRTLGRIFEQHFQLDSASVYYDKAYELAEAENQYSDQASALFDIGYIAENSGDRDNAIDAVQDGIKIYQQIQDTVSLIFGYKTLGWFYSNGGMHDKAIVPLFNSLRLAELLNRKTDIGRAFQAIGIIYNKQNDFEKANFYFSQAMDIFKELKDTTGMITVHNDFGIFNKNQGNYEAAEKEYQKILEYSSYTKYAWSAGTAINNLSLLYYNMNDFQKGLTYGLEGVARARKTKELRAETSALNYTAKNYLGLGMFDDAISYAKQSLSLAKKSDLREKERDASLTLSEAYEKTDQLKLALDYYKAYKNLYDSIFNDDKTKLIHELETKYETEKKDKEIAILAKNAELNKLKSTRLWVTLIATFLIGVILFFFQRSTQRKKREIEAHKRKVAELENQRLNQELVFKKQELSSKVLQLCRKNEFLQSIDKQVKSLKSEIESSNQNKLDRISRQINKDMNEDAHWDQFLRSFEEVDTSFTKKINETYPDFTAGEYRLACLLRMNLGTNEIANLLNITSEGVRKAKFRMRKKMDINKDQNINEFFMNY